MRTYLNNITWTNRSIYKIKSNYYVAPYLQTSTTFCTHANPKAILLLQTRITMLCPNKILCKVQVRIKDRSHFLETIVQVSYLGSWVLVAHAILLDSCWIRIHSFWRPFGQAVWIHSLLVAIEFVSRAFSLGWSNISTPFWVACREGNKSILRDYFREIALSFLFQHHFWHVLWLT